MIFRKSITAKFMATVFLVLLFAQSIGSVVFLLHIRSSFLEEIETRMTQSASIIAGVSAFPLLSFDYTQIDAYLDEVAKDDEITSIRIYDSQGKAVREKYKSEDAAVRTLNPFYIRKAMTATAPISSGGNKIGAVAVHFTGSTVNDNIQKSIIIIVVYQGISLIILGFVMLYLFNKNIKKPVSEISRAIEKITNGDLITEMPDLRDNEIGNIGKGISFLKGRLAQMTARINETAASVSRAIGQVNLTHQIASEGIARQSTAVREIVHALQQANKSYKEISDSVEKLLGFSTENVTSLLQMKASSEEMAAQTQRLFKATEDSYSVVVEMTQSSKSISVHAGQALSAVEDTSASVEEVGASVREVEEHAGDSSKIAERVKEITSGIGMMSVVNAIEGMDNISEQVKKSAEIIQRLGARSIDIEKVLSVIRDVTEQTNLLSLNAAILAAQAGEYGKSFSVVADEIRALSERTASSTREIGGIVKTIQRDIKDAVYSVDTAQLKVDEGNSLVVKVGESLRDILQASMQSADMTKAIERATSEQALGLRQIMSAVEDIRRVFATVTKATKEEENALGYLLEGVGDVKEVAEGSKRGASGQAEGTRYITKNIELANERIAKISNHVSDQKKVNTELIASMEQLNAIGLASAQEMANVSNSLKTLIREIDNLKREMGVFKIR